MLKYLKCKKESLQLGELQQRPPWDLYVSAFNDSERVRSVFAAFPAAVKHWCITAEYGYQQNEYPTGAPTFEIAGNDEAASITKYFENAGIDPLTSQIAIDITGFMRPQIMFLVKYLQKIGVSKFDAIYSEPKSYKEKEKTVFALGDVTEVRQIAGFEGSHPPGIAKDLLVIAAGYDKELVARVVGHKESARVVLVYGLPSLSPDMYQQSVVQMWEPTNAIQGREFEGGVRFTSANDPFTTAEVLSSLWREGRDVHKLENLYLSPLGTKPQTLGVALFFVRELETAQASVLFPFSKGYSRETSVGIGKIWVYSVELV